MNNVYPIEARVIPPQPGMATRTSGSGWIELIHKKSIQRRETVVLAATARGERDRGTPDDLAPASRLLIVQDRSSDRMR